MGPSPISSRDTIPERRGRILSPMVGPPLLIVQCKRQRAKIEKAVIKALWADVQAEGATRGMVATTNSISPGAESTIAARGYSIDSADQAAITHWLQVMRTPGQGPSLV